MPSETGDGGKPDSQIILFTFPESVYGRRIARYLNLRQIPFTQIRVPPNMPRPILSERLGIQYRRIPVLSIGRDIYIDTRLILRKLESLDTIGDPSTRLGAKDSFGSGIEDILEEFIIDGGPFWRTAGLIPVDSPLMQDPVWVKDRFDGSGGQFTKEKLVQLREWNLSQERLYFGMVEKLLGDGRKWLLGGEGPGLAEIHAGWVFDWAISMAEGVPDGRYAAKEDLRRELGEERFPKVWEWVRRFREVTMEAEQRNKGAGVLGEGRDAEDAVVEKILEAQFTERGDLEFDENDVLGLKKGQKISVSPTDFGFTHKDEGKLAGLTKDEVVIESPVPKEQGIVRLHFPRFNFKVLPAS
ncbi:hypothetical protein CKM354_000055400 [Cercospora kikuchii]|uniref:GST N-terminal domain-containing protein n=1 Tax=Cercospora kikuchii TaxID=84275 RepID=A0A9P3C6H4_9PEZI|nr:uncharacterized protein CKM354_000055400 [Cercospora kikuchii]GIZ37091.1 hypothetical protein CKM354_000055400 [Cercospora kikuchii]